MEQKEAEIIISERFGKEDTKNVLTCKELAFALKEDPEKVREYLNKMVSDGLLKWYHADTIYYERIT